MSFLRFFRGPSANPPQAPPSTVTLVAQTPQDRFDQNEQGSEPTNADVDARFMPALQIQVDLRPELFDPSPTDFVSAMIKGGIRLRNFFGDIRSFEAPDERVYHSDLDLDSEEEDGGGDLR